MKKTTPTQAFLATIKNNFLKTLTGKLKEKNTQCIFTFSLARQSSYS